MQTPGDRELGRLIVVVIQILCYCLKRCYRKDICSALIGKKTAHKTVCTVLTRFGKKTKRNARP